MIEVTDSAQKQIAEYFVGRQVMPLRVFLHQGGWAGPSLALALDEPKDSDEVYEVAGFKFIADTDFLKQAAPVNIDFSEMGFKITSSMDLGGGGCSGCGTSSNCCS